VVTLIGANGAGKSTMLKSISGLLRPTNGTIEFEGNHLNGKRPDEIIRSGISHCPEGRKVFPEMTLLENLEMGAYTNREETKEMLDYCYEMFPMLEDRHKQFAGTLSGGEQQMLAIARALMCKPKLIMFDEPSMGLAPKIVEQVADTIMNINSDGTAVLLVEQNAYMALNMANYAYVLETGKIALNGKAQDMLGNDHVRKAYLGR
jgi:branched-chain amino acid transport system ATP-binding protein